MRLSSFPVIVSTIALLLLIVAACEPDQSGLGGELDASLEGAEPAAQTDASASGSERTRGDAGSTQPPPTSAADASRGEQDAASTDPVRSDASTATDPSDAGLPGDAGDASMPGDPSDPRDPSDKRCGTRGGTECSAKQFCNFEPDVDCGGTDRGGVCEDIPKACGKDLPVCGCDGLSYASRCLAHRAGVSVKHDGPCKLQSGGAAEGEQCAGFAGISCADGLFCNLEPPKGQGCEKIADAAGVCQKQPELCTLQYQPVCGCDGVTHGSACAAHGAGVSVQHMGECGSAGNGPGNGNGKACSGPASPCTDLECEQIKGEIVFGIGPPPSCAAGTTSAGWVTFTDGQIPFEGALCCVAK